MSLTKEQRMALPSSHFAFPSTRQCPIHDEKHVVMAMSQIDNTKGATELERVEARARVVARGTELKMDMSRWIRGLSFSVQAMSLDVPETEDHPNKMDFSGVLTKVDQSSDLAPHGSMGKKVFIAKEVAEKALPTLLGMAIDLTSTMKGHDRKRKIGVITAATVEGSDVRIKGFFYANDFPEEVQMIQANKEDLGFSFEAERIVVESLEQDPLKIQSLVFTGAAVLHKKSAAYQTTSLAASAEETEMDKEQYDALMAAISGLGTRVEKIEKTRLEAASVADKVAAHAKTLHECANAMSAAGIGCHATRGHSAILRHMADEMMAEAHRGLMPSTYHGMSMYAAGDQGEDSEIKKELKTLKDGLKAAQDENAALKTKVTDLSARADKQSAPDRKTLPARIQSLMAKGALTLPENGEKFSISKIDAVLKGTSLNPSERIEVKIGLERAGLVATQ